MTIASRIRRLNVMGGLTLLLIVNASAAIPRMYKGVQHPVGPELVSVHLPSGEAGDVLTPVQDAADKETDQRVRVYLRNGYKDDLITVYPSVNLVVLAAMGLIHLLSHSATFWTASGGRPGEGSA